MVIGRDPGVDLHWLMADLPVRRGKAGQVAIKPIGWNDHAVLYALNGRGRKQLMAGRLHVLVDLALSFVGGVDATVIETDGGAMFCRHEIGYIGMDATRPRA